MRLALTFMQPWDFVVVRDIETKRQIKVGFNQAHAESAEMFTDESRRCISA